MDWLGRVPGTAVWYRYRLSSKGRPASISSRVQASSKALKTAASAHAGAMLSAVRTAFLLSFLASGLVATLARAQSPLTKILTGELERNYESLKKNGDPAPYFMGYEVSDIEAGMVSASRGALQSQSLNHARLLDVTIRVGSPKFDNYRRTGRDRVRFTSANPIALADSAAPILHTEW